MNTITITLNPQPIRQTQIKVIHLICSALVRVGPHNPTQLQRVTGSDDNHHKLQLYSYMNHAT